jgi:threonylcarbamoyladenosine tRNA methylthiotransferase MtaB
MRTFTIFTLGCKVNQYESQQIRQLLTQSGLTQVETADRPDLVVINTCCVTHTASAKSRRSVHQAQRHRPKAVVVCGCLPAAGTNELAIDAENLHVVHDRNHLASTLSLLVATNPTTPDQARTDSPVSRSPGHLNDTFIRPKTDQKIKRKHDLYTEYALPAPAFFEGQTRAFLKVQDGCDAFCTYCIIPIARPSVLSKPLSEVVAEARTLVASGHKEIVITGVHVGAYGLPSIRNRSHDVPPPVGATPCGCLGEARRVCTAHLLPDLLAEVAKVPDLARIRLSSLDPADVTDRLMDVFASHPNIMPHLHLSLQSGSNEVLRRMARPYNADEFRAKIDLVRSRLDRPAITTDIIVGFPGETDADFAQTLALAREVAFSKMHVFAFSARKDTAAARMQDKVPSEVKKERSRILRDLDTDLQSQFRRQFLGETAQVLIESTALPPSGRSERYFTVQVEAGLSPSTKSTPSTASTRPYKNQIITVKLTQNTPTTLLGTPLPSSPD